MRASLLALGEKPFCWFKGELGVRGRILAMGIGAEGGGGVRWWGWAWSGPRAVLTPANPALKFGFTRCAPRADPKFLL